MICRAGRMIGLPDMLPLSLAKAMTEPEKVIAPMAAPSDISSIETDLIAPGSPIPNASGARNAAQAMNTAAMPTRLWNAATSCGIAVIGMRRAISAPGTAPAATATRIRTQVPKPLFSSTNSVVRTASPMPIMPKRLPAREVSGEDSPLSARMNRMPETT